MIPYSCKSSYCENCHLWHEQKAQVNSSKNQNYYTKKENERVVGSWECQLSNSNLFEPQIQMYW